METVYVKVGENYEPLERIVVDRQTLELGYWGDPNDWLLQEDYDALIAAIEEAEKENEGYIS